LIFPSISYEALQHVPDVEEEPEARGRGEKILLLETQSGESQMMVRYLEHIGFGVLTVESRDAAIEALRGGDIELVLMDHQTADNPGKEDVNEFREAANSAFLPIVLLTSRGFAFDIEKFLRDGIDLCLVTPVALKQLGRICRELIDGEYIDSGINEKLNKSQTSDLRRPAKGGPGIDDIIQ
jgi:DNA-binding response OmpR family regulator